MSKRASVLLAVTVYNGRTLVSRCLESAKHIQSELADVDVLVLDDCSPEGGFSEFLRETCKRIDVNFYRSPRNLGIVRNVNLGLLSAVQNDYDYVIISNSDVVYSRQTVDHLIEAARTDARIGSVTAWSNNVSIYSIPNAAPDLHLSSQEVVDWLAASLAGPFRRSAVDIPAGISFCILIPTQVVRDVGLMDPAFGRGYCEETDWSLRSLERGYRICLAPAAFVYHQGRGSTLAAGMVSGGHTTVPANEALIDFRYPLFRSQVDAFVHGGIRDELWRSALQCIIRDAGKQFDYRVGMDGFVADGSGDAVQVLSWGPPSGSVRASFRGFEALIPVGPEPFGSIRSFFGTDPKKVWLADRPMLTRELGQRALAGPSHPSTSPFYPARI